MSLFSFIEYLEEGGELKHFWRLSVRHKSQITAGSLSGEHFRKLIDISTIHSDKVIQALEDYCVNGYDRKSACDKYKVSQGYFSISLRKLQKLNDSIAELITYYING